MRIYYASVSQEKYILRHFFKNPPRVLCYNKYNLVRAVGEHFKVHIFNYSKSVIRK